MTLKKIVFLERETIKKLDGLKKNFRILDLAEMPYYQYYRTGIVGFLTGNFPLRGWLLFIDHIVVTCGKSFQFQNKIHTFYTIGIVYPKRCLLKEFGLPKRLTADELRAKNFILNFS